MSCSGGIVLSWRDLRPGAGWGLMDARGRVKAPWYVLRRVLAPVALLVTDEGLNGLRLHVMNDLPEELVGEVAVELVADGERTVEEVRAPVRVGGRITSRWTPDRSSRASGT